MNRYKGILIAFMAMVAGLLINCCFSGLDTGLFRLINSPHYPWLDSIMRPVTHLGNSVILLLAAIGIWCIRGRRRFLQALVSVIFAGIIVLTIKRVFPTDRPAAILDGVNIIGQYLKIFSFPSGHTASIFALAVIIRSEFRRVMPLFWVVAALVAVSRVYVGAHFPSDVFFGAGLGYVVGMLVSILFEKERGDKNGKD